MQKFILPFLCAGIAGTLSLSAQEYKSQRPAEQDRLFRSEAVEAKILEVQRMLTNPRLAWMFAKLGFLTADFMKKYRRHAIVIILVIAAIITPTSDVFTLLVVSLPIWLLYEASIGIVKRTEKRAGSF